MKRGEVFPSLKCPFGLWTMMCLNLFFLGTFVDFWMSFNYGEAEVGDFELFYSYHSKIVVNGTVLFKF